MNAQEKILWYNIVKNIDKLPKQSRVYKLIFSYLKRTTPIGQPSIHVCDDKVYYDGKCLDLGAKEKMAMAFKAFANHNAESMTRYELIKQIYHPISLMDISYRQLTCHQHNVVKLLSRARRLADKTFGCELVQWFPYDHYSQTWTLCSYKSDPKSLMFPKTKPGTF